MDEIIMQQKNAAKALSGKAFLLGVAEIVLCLALAQMAINLIIRFTGVGLLNILFYAYAVWLLLAFMRRTVASYVYTLKHGVLYLEKKLGDSTMSLVEVPLCRVVSMRPVYMAERMKTSYELVTVIDPAARPSSRVRAAFAASLFSARAARLIAGKRAYDQIGHAIVFIEDGKRHVCVFRPDEAMCAELKKQLDQAYGFDERMTKARVHTLYARALERAFPSLYAYVDPLIRPEDIEQAKAELAAQKEQKKNKRAKKNKDEKHNGNEKKSETKTETQIKTGAEREADGKRKVEEDQTKSAAETTNEKEKNRQDGQKRRRARQG